MDRLNSLNIYYQNVRGLRTKTHDFLHCLLLSDYDLIFLTETWLTSDFLDSELFPPRYDVYRRDRPGGARGGGVLVAARAGLHVQRRTWCSTPHAEELWLTVGLSSAPRAAAFAPASSTAAADSNRGTLHVACAYFPHGADHCGALQSFYDAVTDRMHQNPDDSYLILGDFNISHAEWSVAVGLPLTLNTNNDNKAAALSDFLSLTNLAQYNCCPNVNGRILDLVLSNSGCHVYTSTSPLTPEDFHHRALEILFPLSRTIYLKENIQSKYVFYAANFDEIGRGLLNTDWQILHTMNTEGALTHFYSILHKLIEDHVPKRRLYFDRKFPPWFSLALTKLVRKKLQIHARWKTYNDPRDYQEFQLLRARVKKLQAQCYNSFINTSEERLTKSPKYFWTFIKSKLSVNNTPAYMSYGEKLSTDGETICSLFNDYFHSVFMPPSVSPNNTFNIDASDSESSVNISEINITPNLVRKLLNQVDVHKGAGVDNVHPLLISKLSGELSFPVSIIYQKSLKEGCFPSIWKKALITPIPKGGDKHDVRQYRPISKLCVLGKIFEKIVTNELNLVMSRHISTQQHGFFRGRSVDTNLVIYTDYLLNSLDSGHQVDAVYTDFSKAFDKIDHRVLISKLFKFGIHGDLLRWLSSYISNRSQAVALKGYTSKFLEISSGIPQGSHLGPLLFTIYINDVDSCFHNSNHLLYADDTKIFRVISTSDDCLKLQSDLQRFEQFCLKDQLFLNPDKCYTISFTRKRNPIKHDYILSGKILKRVNVIKDLGVLLDAELRFDVHIDSIASRAYKQLGMILRLARPFKKPFTYKVLYYSFVRSVLEFASVVWNPQYTVHIDRIEGIQNKFLKSLDYRTGHVFVDYTTTSDRHKIFPLGKRRDYLDTIFLYKIINNVIDSSPLLELINIRIPRISLRSKSTFHVIKYNTNYAGNSFIRRSCRFYNDKLHSTDIFSATLGNYKECVRTIIFGGMDNMLL